ncbi:hypothetical protein [Coleofasciculus sp. C1-SOL-03]|uniref:hypothetical protein n=1 Tax=Coleofasciculus sp. C1-SOL-03 TaxID=3069522 RepID=UPI0040644296
MTEQAIRQGRWSRRVDAIAVGLLVVRSRNVIRQESFVKNQGRWTSHIETRLGGEDDQ